MSESTAQWESLLSAEGAVLYDPLVAIELAAEILSPAPSPHATKLHSYWYDPCGFIREYVPDLWASFTPYQKEALDNLCSKKRLSIRSPHGTGKTTLVAAILLWFACTRDGYDWKAVTTASVWRQLSKFLWPEVHKWLRYVDWEKLGRKAPDPRREALQMSLSLRTGEAFATASDVPENIEGAHADFLLYIYDESKTIKGETFDASEGAFSNAGTPLGRRVCLSDCPATHTEAYAVSISTPGEPNGRFYEIQSRKPGYEDWWVRHITLAEAIAAGRINELWAQQRKRQWGEHSAIYKNRVLGEFASDAVDGVIPLQWAEEAMLRWEAPRPSIPLTCIGVDVAGYGSDDTIYAKRQGRVVAELIQEHHVSTQEIAGQVTAMLCPGGKKVWPHAYPAVDVIGIGAGVVDRLRENRLDVYAFNGAAAARDGDGRYLTDISGEITFANMRAHAWWALRDLLNPDNNFLLALPPDDELLGDLVSPKYRRLGGGSIIIETKDEIKKRLGRSPDRGDAVVMSLAVRPQMPDESIYLYDDAVHISNY